MFTYQGKQYVKPTPEEKAAQAAQAAKVASDAARESKVKDTQAIQAVTPFTLKPGEQRFGVLSAAAPAGQPTAGTQGIPPFLAAEPGAGQSAPGQPMAPIASVASVPPKPTAPTEWQIRLDAAGGDAAKALKQLQQDKLRQRAAGRAPESSTPIEPLGTGDPASNDILSQTGLSVPAFYALVGENSKLPRDKSSRIRAMAEAQEFSKKRGVDISTLASQYKAYNGVLSSNISRFNNTVIMEQEVLTAIQNLAKVANSKDLGRLNFANVAKVWAGQQVNDNLAQQYAFHLEQLRTDLTQYFAASQGRTGNNLTLDDARKAEGVIRNGISTGSLDGLSEAVKSSTDKLKVVLEGSVDRSRRAVWDLFGVGKNYKNKYESGNPQQAPSPGSRPPLSSFER